MGATCPSCESSLINGTCPSCWQRPLLVVAFVALLAELDRLRERAQAAEDRAEMAAHNTRWGTR